MSLFNPETQGELIKRNEKRLNRLERRANPGFRIAALEADVAILSADSGWITVSPLLNSFIVPTVSPRYRKKAGIVYTAGGARRAAAPVAYTTVFILPAGYRPSTTVYAINSDPGGATFLFVQILTTGEVQVKANAAVNVDPGYPLVVPPFPAA